MMKRLLFIFVLSFISLSSFAQPRLLVDSVSEYKWSSLTRLSDIWGYQDTTGVEYALVCRRRGFSVVSLADTANPVEIYSDTSIFSIWRDVKTWKKHAYVVNESGLGLEIYDLSKLPDSVTKVGTYTGSTYPFLTAHNIFIDSSGVAYLFGTNNRLPGGGTIMLDVDTDPKNPVDLGNYDSLYLHDGVVRDSILYGGAVNDGLFIIVDVRNKANPQIIGSVRTPSSFTHNVWLSDDGNTAFTTDEVVGAYVTAYDVRNPQSIVELDRIRTRGGSNIIPHNTHVLNDFLVTSYYTKGVSIIDGSRPGHLVEVGYFDTSPNFNGGTFNGNWGAYPYLPSGLCLLSDMEEGLFVVRPKYQRASFFEGNVIDCNQNAVSQALVEIVGEGLSTNTNLIGDFDLGNVLNGFYTVRISAPNYITRTIDSVELRPGNVQFLNVEMQDANRGFIHTVYDNRNNPIDGVLVTVENSDTSFTDTTVNGKLSFNDLDFGTYNIYVGKWGYENICLENFVYDCLNDSLSHTLIEGYEDDFNNDLGWRNDTSLVTNAGFGFGRINPTTNQDPLFPLTYIRTDDSLDCGGFALTYIDSSRMIPSMVALFSTVKSPLISLSNYVNPFLNISYWFREANPNTSPPIGYIVIEFQDSLSNPIVSDTIIDTVRNSTIYWRWNRISIPLTNLPYSANGNKVAVTLAHLSPFGTSTGGIDNFSITEGLPVGIAEQSNAENEMVVYPNPFENNLTLRFKSSIERQIKLYNTQMQLVYESNSANTKVELQLDGSIQEGLYILRIEDLNGNTIQRKLIKL